MSVLTATSEKAELHSSAITSSREAAVLLISVLLVSACAILYELIISTASSYFLGSSVLHFSLTIGLFMFFLGVGAFVSKWVNVDLLSTFISIELLLGLIGGVSTILLYGSFAVTPYYYLCALCLIAAVATLSGLEVPILTRLLRDYQALKDALAHILSFDYVGALLASLLFPLILLPYLGLMKTGVVVGLLNVLVAGAVIWEFRRKVVGLRFHVAFFVFTLTLLSVVLVYTTKLSGFLEQQLYQDEIVYTEQSPYQKIILTTHQGDTRLYLNGDLQFSTVDEYRYHESLVHPALSLAKSRSSILLLGAGDGLAVREILKYADVERITIVDLDKAVTDLAKSHAALRAINQDSLLNPKVRILNEDAWKFIYESKEIFSVIISDLPDPNDLSLGRLYSHEFYQLLKKRLSPTGLLVTQATSPYFSRDAYWTIERTLAASFEHTAPYHAEIPSFGDWGFVMASDLPLDPTAIQPPSDLQFLTKQVATNLFAFPKDIAKLEGPVNRLDNQDLVRLYEQGWKNGY